MICWEVLLNEYRWYIYIFIRQKGSSNKWKKHQTHNKNKQTKERKKNYAEIGQASEQFSGLDVTQNEANEENKLLKTVTQ